MQGLHVALHFPTSTIHLPKPSKPHQTIRMTHNFNYPDYPFPQYTPSSTPGLDDFDRLLGVVDSINQNVISVGTDLRAFRALYEQDKKKNLQKEVDEICKKFQKRKERIDNVFEEKRKERNEDIFEEKKKKPSPQLAEQQPISGDAVCIQLAVIVICPFIWAFSYNAWGEGKASLGLMTSGVLVTSLTVVCILLAKDAGIRNERASTIAAKKPALPQEIPTKREA